MKRQFRIICLFTICSLFSSCLGWGFKNDVNVKASGQFYIEEEGELVPFRHKMRCWMEYTLVSKVTYGFSTDQRMAGTYSDEDGHFSFELHDIGSWKVHFMAFYYSGDTMSFKCDTNLYFYESKGSLPNLQLIVDQGVHEFNPVVLPKRIHYGDSCTITINHDCMTHIALAKLTNSKFDILCEKDVDNSPSCSFVVPEYFREQNIKNFYVLFTTLHYGTWNTQSNHIYTN